MRLLGQNLEVVVDVNCLPATMLKSYADVIGAVCTIFYMDNAKNCPTRQCHVETHCTTC